MATLVLLFSQRQATLEKAQKQLAAHVTNFAEDIDDRISATAQLLFGLARVPVLANADRRVCSDFLANVLKEYSQFTSLLTISPDGSLHCDSLHTGRILSLADRQYFQDAVQSTRYVVEPVIGRLTGKGVLQIAYPVRDDHGKLLHVLLASFNLDDFASSVATSLPYPHKDVRIWGANNTPIVQTPGGVASLARLPAAQRAQEEVLLTRAPGGVLSIGAGADTKIWATAVVQRPHNLDVRLAMGLPEHDLYGAIDTDFRATMVGLGVTALLLFLVAAAFAEVTIRRQTAKLTAAVTRLDAGDYVHPIGLPYPNGELGHVMGALDRLGSSLETQRHEIAQTHQALEQAANFDSLTGLANRTQLNKRLDSALAHARRARRRVAVLVLDLDRFKTVNDSLGHSKGDAVLQETARRLQTCLRRGDTIARLGGDEFVVVLADMASVSDALPLAEEIVQTLAQPIALQGQTVSACASVGISTFPDDGQSSEVLLRNADTAMYRAKAQGGNAVAMFAAEMTHSVTARLETEAGLRQALERGELRLHYQPIVEIASGRIVSAEALVRWVHPVKGIIYPADFIAVAEQTGLIVPVGEWVLRQACQQMQAWRQRGIDIAHIAVNLSARQFSETNIVATVEAILHSTGCPRGALHLEVTESMVMTDAQSAMAIMHQLRALDVQFSIDDFGTGYSSLSYLKQLPVKKLKIDRSFVRDIETDSNDRAIVDAILTLAKKLTLRTVAEGVECQGQLDILGELGCTSYQGYLFARPCPADAFERLVKASASPAIVGEPVLPYPPAIGS